MTKKNYTFPEETPQTVNEPQAAYGYRAEIQRPPCQYSLEELNKRLDQAEEEARQGLGLTTEELRGKYKPSHLLASKALLRSGV